MNQILRADDPADSSGAPAPEAPESPAAAKRGRTAKTPGQVDLEKRLSRVEDRMDGFDSALSGVNEFLEKLDFTPKTKAQPGSPEEKDWLDKLLG